MTDSQTVKDLVLTLEIGPSATAGNLALLPLLASKPVATADLSRYLLYQQAQEMGLISIEEVSEAGAVGTLRVVNRAAQPVLLVEGEVLLGMKQARVLNLTILVPATAALEVPVSCVESGRWRAVSEEATGKAAVNLAPSVRAAKTVTVARSMRSARSFASDQGAVWAGVDRVLDRHGAHAPTRSYADLAASNAVNLAAIASSVEPAPRQIGVIACVGGRVACVDIFERPEVLASLWSGLVASYQAEALTAYNLGSKPLDARADAAARRWFRSIPGGSTSVGPDIGLGSHVSVVAPELEAAALVHAGRVLHISAFPAHQAVSHTSFAPPARRRS